MAAHAVGDRPQPAFGAGEHGIFVEPAPAADVGPNDLFESASRHERDLP
jgi:hypothetical protein